MRFTWISGWGSASPVWWRHVPSSRWGRWGCSSCCWTRRWRRDRRMTGRSASPPEWYPPRRRKHTAPSANHPAPSEPCWRTYGRTGSPYWSHFLVSLREIPSHPLLMRVKKGGRKIKGNPQLASDFIWIILISIMSQSLNLTTFVFFAPLYIDFSAACIVASWLGSSTWASSISRP